MCAPNFMAVPPVVSTEISHKHQPAGGATGKVSRIHHLGTTNVSI